MMAPTAYVQGLAFWAPNLPDWDAACAAFVTGKIPDAGSARAPRPLLLDPGDRRRAPETVALALEAGRMAIESADHPVDQLLSVFASAHGDLAIIDYLCATLAQTPSLVSPTRFLNSIHNAPAGMWSMAANCMQASTAVTAGDQSFATGLLEALMQCETEQQGVLFVAYESAAKGALTRTISSRTPVAFALVLTPRGAGPSLTWSTERREDSPAAVRTDPARSFADTSLASGMLLIEMLALREAGHCQLNLSGSRALSLQLCFPPGEQGRQATERGRPDAGSTDSPCWRSGP